jgi:hypothetical protein
MSCENIAQNVAQHTFRQNQYNDFYLGKKLPKIRANAAIFKKLPKGNNRPKGRNLAQSGRVARLGKFSPFR